MRTFPLSAEPILIKHNVDDLIELFEHTFYAEFNTRLVIGNDEPIYLPVNTSCTYNQIVFAHGFYASALHEISHWCLAGKKRRLQEDFGYWYLPDGRDAQQQEKFEQVEIKPQAIEWALSAACGRKFEVSVDNLNGDAEPDRFAFKDKVLKQVSLYLTHGFPEQAQQFINVLANFYFNSVNNLTLSLSLKEPQEYSQHLLRITLNKELSKALGNKDTYNDNNKQNSKLLALGE